jgi:hypothetical protein
MLTMQWPQQAPGDEWRRRYRLQRDPVRSAWAEFLGRVPWDLFLTLTFDPGRVYPVDRDRADREAFEWCTQTARIYRKPLGWVYAPERGRSGLWHVHVLIVGGPRMAGTPSTLPEAAGMWTARNGRLDVRRIHDVPGITLYSTKQAALSGTLVWSDTLGNYRTRLNATVVPLCPESVS